MAAVTRWHRATRGVSLAAPGWALDPNSHVPVGAAFPGYVRVLTGLFNIAGALPRVWRDLARTAALSPAVSCVTYPPFSLWTPFLMSLE
jgi:hypothetical protein